MRKFILAAMMAMTAAPVLVAADPALAQDRRDWRDDRRGNDRRDEWRNGRQYDWNRYDRRNGDHYDASRYYRDDRRYRERRLSRNDRVYRGDDGRYYCRRKDGTTGLIVGALAGGVLGNALDNGRSSLLGTVLGAAGGGLLGRSIDRGEARCR
ncbi:glycine zipper 2TM domain-containing protein [Sphingomonas montanisoli]|uniref:17 kDa surface antigen n=1 Tax=Sphingomonas montanisoli TaxID=2606412 RepID=A0A5D9C1I9_9SPHN|nr:glycine zipper 2TM domain-containing protein [Sphingomonas montanisoli]TZG25162.1 glycine zipper 2TM domain-containing protein [Sphingomonas montanisoli]